MINRRVLLINLIVQISGSTLLDYRSAVAYSDPPKVLTSRVTGMKLLRIEAGVFDMGSADDDRDAEPDEKPRHRVKITRPFYMGAYEVTQGQYAAVMREHPSYFPDSVRKLEEGARSPARRSGELDEEPKSPASRLGVLRPSRSFENRNDYPVESLSWYDAVRFCNALSQREGLEPYYREVIFMEEFQILGGNGYRLPTEAEWEYACRAGSTSRYSFGDDASDLDAYGWHAKNSSSAEPKEGFPTPAEAFAALSTHPVGRKKPNAFGLYDMHGNVREWCWDRHGNYANEPLLEDPTGAGQGAPRVLRGGSFADQPSSLRSAERASGHPLRHGARATNGLRVVRTVD